MASNPAPRLTISACLLRPFVKLLANYQLKLSDELFQVATLEPSARVTIRDAHQRVLRAVQLTGDLDLGLKAGRITDLEHLGPLAYAASAAPTLREAMGVASRFMKLLTDVLRYELTIEDTRAIVRLHTSVTLSRVALDFVASALNTHHRRTHAAELPGLVWSFPYAQPSSLREHERTFGAAELRFSAPCLGFSFDACSLDTALITADERQHEALIRQMEAMLAGASHRASLANRVRQVVTRQLPAGGTDVGQVARELGMSRRTLARRLGHEQTSFTRLVDDTRRHVAMHHLEQAQHSIATVATLAGFAEVSTFYRAFRRWTELTPVQFRRGQRPTLSERASVGANRSVAKRIRAA